MDEDEDDGVYEEEVKRVQRKRGPAAGRRHPGHGGRTRLRRDGRARAHPQRERGDLDGRGLGGHA